MKKVEGYSDYAKNKDGVVVCVNKDKIEKARRVKMKRKEKDQRTEKMEDEISKIKFLLEKLINEKNNK